MTSETDLAQKKSTDSEVRLGDLSEDVSFLTRTLRALMRGEVNGARQDLGIEPGEIGVLKLIKANPGISQSQLAETVVLKKSAVTRIVRTLMDKGLVSRERVVSDKRYKALQLTQKGLDRVERVNARINALHNEWFVDFTPEEREQFYRTLGRMIDILAARNLPDRSNGE